jgi:hypothetical protein
MYIQNLMNISKLPLIRDGNSHIMLIHFQDAIHPFLNPDLMACDGFSLTYVHLQEVTHILSQEPK